MTVSKSNRAAAAVHLAPAAPFAGLPPIGATVQTRTESDSPRTIRGTVVETYDDHGELWVTLDVHGWRDLRLSRYIDRRAADVELPARPAVLLLQSWAGVTQHQVLVIAETPKRYRIRSAGGDPLRLGGRRRTIAGMGSVLVPKTAIRFEEVHS